MRCGMHNQGVNMTRYDNLRTATILATVTAAAIAIAPGVAKTLAKGAEAVRSYRQGVQERNGYALLERFRNAAPAQEAPVATGLTPRELQRAVNGLDAYDALEIGYDTSALAPEVTLPLYAQRT